MAPKGVMRPSSGGHKQIKLLKHTFELCSLPPIFSKTSSLATLAQLHFIPQLKMQVHYVTWICQPKLRFVVFLVSLSQGSHASWKILECPGFFFFKIPGPGKSWKITLVLESPGNRSLRSGKSWKNILENYTSLKSPASLALNLVSWFSAK